MTFNNIYIIINIIEINLSVYFNLLKDGEDMDLNVPEWIQILEAEDLTFVRNFLLASGSLKEISQLYHVSYPTIRLRLDKIIQKIKISEQEEQDPFVLQIKRMAIEDRINLETAKNIISL